MCKVSSRFCAIENKNKQCVRCYPRGSGQMLSRPKSAIAKCSSIHDRSDVCRTNISCSVLWCQPLTTWLRHNLNATHNTCNRLRPSIFMPKYSIINGLISYLLKPTIKFMTSMSYRVVGLLVRKGIDKGRSVSTLPPAS